MCDSVVRVWIDNDTSPRFLLPIVDRYYYETHERKWHMNMGHKVFTRNIIKINGYTVHVAVDYDSGKPIYFGKALNI